MPRNCLLLMTDTSVYVFQVPDTVAPCTQLPICVRLLPSPSTGKDDEVESIVISCNTALSRTSFGNFDATRDIIFSVTYCGVDDLNLCITLPLVALHDLVGDIKTDLVPPVSTGPNGALVRPLVRGMAATIPHRLYAASATFYTGDTVQNNPLWTCDSSSLASLLRHRASRQQKMCGTRAKNTYPRR